ncbi:hypothetical protein HJFPF1_00838 [Paramyrothecium foliicola]|nr:hypothetical protein HJFPF1_00838 [Paramyrothecium foliicola]
MEPPPEAEDAPQSPIRFRPGKKRKAAYRQRGADDDDDAAAAEHEVPEGGRPDSDVARAVVPAVAIKVEEGASDDEAAVAAALRLRNARKGRLGGVGFRSDARPDDDDTASSASRALVLADQEGPASDAVVGGITNRFTHQTGLIGELNDKHMTEYIESRLSSRKAPSAPPGSRAAPAADGQMQQQGHAQAVADPAGSRPREQPVLQGKLMEVDLQEAMQERGRNGAKDDGSRRGAKRQRLGKDGKPWRPRNRRGSDDIKRDQLVEQFLHENRLDVYDVSTPASSALDTADEDGAADERLAEQFQKQYMDDMAQRRQRRKPAQPAKPTTEDVLKGPKLGGSRNSRAAMRDFLLKKEKEAKDTKR